MSDIKIEPSSTSTTNTQANSTISTSTNTNSNVSQNPQGVPVLPQYIQMKPQTPAQIRASGDAKVQIGILWFVGIISSLLVVIGGISLILDPKNAKDVWVIIGPIVSSAITGTVAYFTGEKRGEQK